MFDSAAMLVFGVDPLVLFGGLVAVAAAIAVTRVVLNLAWKLALVASVVVGAVAAAGTLAF